MQRQYQAQSHLVPPSDPFPRNKWQLMSLNPVEDAESTAADASTPPDSPAPRPALRRTTTLARAWKSTATTAVAIAREDAAAAKARKQQLLITFIQDSQLSLAAFLRQQGEYERALDIYSECLAKREAVLGEEHPETLLLAHAVAYTLHLQGDVRALPLLEESVAKWSAMHGEEHPNTALYKARRDACAKRLAEAAGQGE